MPWEYSVLGSQIKGSLDTSSIDVFENLRKTCLKHYNLDPAHYYTSPGFKGLGMHVLNRQVNLLNFNYYEINDMLMMVEYEIRGGITQCNQNS